MTFKGTRISAHRLICSLFLNTSCFGWTHERHCEMGILLVPIFTFVARHWWIQSGMDLHIGKFFNNPYFIYIYSMYIYIYIYIRHVHIRTYLCIHLDIYIYNYIIICIVIYTHISSNMMIHWPEKKKQSS